MKELSKYIFNKKIALSIYSSGNIKENNKLIPLRVEDLQYLANLGPIRLVLSLEGSQNLINDKMTAQPGSFDNTLVSIKRAIDLDIQTEIHFVPTKINYKELPAVVSLAKRMGVKEFSILRFVPQGRGEINKEILELEKIQLYELKEMFSELEKYSTFVRIGSPFNPFLLTKQYECTAGYNRLTILPNGYVVPCEAIKFLADKFEDNNVKKYSLKYIWEKSIIFNEARQFNKYIHQSDCINCEYYSSCKGGCPAQRIINEKFTKYETDPLCLRKGVIINVPS